MNKKIPDITNKAVLISYDNFIDYQIYELMSYFT